jgi:DNA-binding transcriptional ArsR family regulator
MKRDNSAREGPRQATPARTEAFKALGHLTRLQVFFFLVRASREVSFGEIQEASSVLAPTLFHHLDVLRRAKLVRSRRQHRRIYCTVNRELVVDLIRLLLLLRHPCQRKELRNARHRRTISYEYGNGSGRARPH